MNIQNILLFAQAAAETASTAGADASGKSGAGGTDMFQLVLMLLVFGAVMWFFILRPQSQERRRRQEMYDGIKKLDKVVTIGGIHGVITDIDENREVATLRIDENNNVKIKIWLSCVGQVLEKDPEK